MPYEASAIADEDLIAVLYQSPNTDDGRIHLHVAELEVKSIAVDFSIDIHETFDVKDASTRRLCLSSPFTGSWRKNFMPW